MKLKNKKTGKIVEFFNNTDGMLPDSLAELCEKWEDYEKVYPYDTFTQLANEWSDCEEPKGYWHIVSMCAGVQYKEDTNNGEDSFNKEIGNKFETEEEAEKAIGKLKALTRLEEAGLKFEGWKHTPLMKTVDGYKIHIEAYLDKVVAVMEDLDLLFGGEE